MTRVYDNWERLVEATLDREELRYLALVPSTNTSFHSSTPTPSRPQRDTFAHVIELVYKLIREAEAAIIFKQDCLMLKPRAQKLAALLRQAAARDGDQLCGPTRRIISDTAVALEKALSLLLKCRRRRRVFVIIPAAAFRETSSRLENSIYNVSWLLRLCASADEYLGLPEIASTKPILSLIWEQIAALYKGSADDRVDAAATLVILAQESDRCRKLLVKEGAVGLLMKLAGEGESEEQENAAKAIALLGRDAGSVQHMINAGVCSVFAEILQQGPMKVQAVAAWAVSELAAHYPERQHLLAQHDIIRLLVSYLVFETVQERRKVTPMHSELALAGGKNKSDACNSDIVRNGSNSDDDGSLLLPGPSDRAVGTEDAETKALRTEMAARALWQLARRNSTISRSIIESRALLPFAVLLEKGPAEVQFNSAMALMEITAVANEDGELRKSAFRPHSPGFKALVYQLFRVIERADSKLTVPCIKAIGNLAPTFKATERKLMSLSPLVKLLDEREAEVSREACIALTRFVRSENNLGVNHSKTIIKEGGVQHLVQLVYFGEQSARSSALILLCYIALDAPESEEIARAELLSLLEWSSRQAYFVQVKGVEKLLLRAKANLELYQSRASS